MDCADLFRVRVSFSGVRDASEKHYRGLFDGTLIFVEDKSMFTFIMFLVILSMNSYITCNANCFITVGDDQVHHPLEDVLAQARLQGRQTNLNLPHSVLKVMSSDDS